MKTNRDHSFDIELATIVGIEKAIMLKNMDYWCRENQRKQIDEYWIDGHWWTEESLRSLAKKYPYMKRSSLNRWFLELEKEGWVMMQKKIGESNLYRPGPVFEAWNLNEDWAKIKAGVLSQNDTSDCPKMGHELSQNGTPDVSNWDTNCLKLGHAPILDIDSNVENDIPPPNGDTPETKKQRIEREAAEAIAYLNEKCQRNFSANEINLKFSRGRLQAGATIEQLKLVVDWAAKSWKGQNWNGKDAEFYWRPETLFNATKFESYRQQSEAYFKKPTNGTLTGDIAEMRKSGIYSTQNK